MTAKTGTTSRLLLSLIVLLIAIAPFAWAAPAVAQMPPQSEFEEGEGMAPDQNGDQPGDGVDDDGDGNPNEADTDEEKPGDAGGDEATEGAQEQDSGDDGGLVEQIGMDVFGSIMTSIVEKVSEAAAALVEKFLTDAAFTLPDPQGEINLFYDKMSGVVQPGAIVLLLLTGLMLTLRGTNYNTAYATQNALPKIVFFFGALAFFPEVMAMISDLTQGIASALLDPSEISAAFQKLLSSAGTGALFAGATGAATGGTISGALAIFAGIIAVVGAVLCFLLVLLNIFKGFMFGALFIAGPLALFAYPIPALSGLATQWFKGMLACTAIPLLWSLEAAIGTAIIADPAMIFGDVPGVGLYSTLVLLILMWMMIKTPFKVLEWAFFGYSSGNSFVGHVAKAAASSLATRGIGK
jgi:hypothetical protein